MSTGRAGGNGIRAGALVVTALLAALAASSCRLEPVAPRSELALARVPAAAPAGARGGAPGQAQVSNETAVPEITFLRTEVRQDTLLIRGQLRPRDSSYRPFYNPDVAGGWMLQVLLNTGPDAPGYWRGYDYIVRGGEWSPAAGTFIVRHITLESGTPGGWGPQCGWARFEPRTRGFEIAVPLDVVGSPASGLDFCLETFATVPCPECDGGVSAESVDFYFVTMDDLVARGAEVVPMRLPASRRAGVARTGRSATDADPRLAMARLSGR